MWLWNLPKPSFDLKFETLLTNLRGRPVCIHSPWWRVWSPPAWRLRGRTRRWRRRPSRRAAPPPCREGRWWSSPHSPGLDLLARSRSRPRIIYTNLLLTSQRSLFVFPWPGTTIAAKPRPLLLEVIFVRKAVVSTHLQTMKSTNIFMNLDKQYGMSC